MSKVKNNILFMLYTVILGSIVGLIIWGFLRIMNYGIEFLWGYLPAQLNFPFYTICVCTAGGLIIGVWKRNFGDYPEELTGVIAKIKKTGRYPYNNVFLIIVSALIPLLAGAKGLPQRGTGAYLYRNERHIGNDIPLPHVRFYGASRIG